MPWTAIDDHDRGGDDQLPDERDGLHVITLHSVTKVVGRGTGRKLLLDQVDWTLPPRARYVILGQERVGKTTLLQILGGSLLPTRGWVERRGIVSSPIALLRFAAPFATPRQLVERLASFYQVDGWRVSRFVERFSDLRGGMDTPIRKLSREARQRLSFGLFYGVPCDYYLFDGRATPRIASLRWKVQEAQLQRSEHAGMVLATSNVREALAFGGTGGILFRGKLSFFPSVEEAVEVFERQKIEHPVEKTEHYVEETRPDDEGESDFF